MNRSSSSDPHAITRKQFLAGAAASAAALAFGAAPAPAANVGVASDEWGGLKVGMHTYTLRKFVFEDAVRMTKELGLKHIGFNPVHLPLMSTPAELERRRKVVLDAGLEIMAIGVIGFRETDPEARKIFECAKAMGMAVISASPAEKTLDQLDPLAEEFQIRVAIHNHGPTDKWPTPERVLEAVSKHSKLIGACVDIGHYKRAGVEPQDAIRKLGERVFDVHLKDVDRPDGPGQSVVMGTGVIDVKAVLAALIEIKFQRNAAIEFEATPDAPMEGIKKSLDHIRECVKALKA